jgi:integrase
MAIHILSARGVQTAGIGDHSDGGGLFLRVTAASASWVWRYTAPDGRRREMGLGRAERATLASCGASVEQARTDAQRHRGVLSQGMDPIAMRGAARAAAKAATLAARADRQRTQETLARIARRYHAECVEPKRTRRHADQWIASLELNVPAELWNAPIDTIKAPALLEALAALQLRVPETASRVRQRLEVIFDDAQFHELCASNPAKLIRRKLADRPVGRRKGNFAALDYRRIPQFIAALRLQPGTAARALEFGILGASRTGEIIGARTDEIDALGVWRIDGERMKGGEEHAVFLSPRALEIVKSQSELGSVYLFPSPLDNTRPLSNMAMLAVLRRMEFSAETTVHGVCRTAFSTWANELGMARPDVIEAALAHREADRVRAAYNRASFDAERRALLAAWANYCDGKEAQPVSPSSAPAMSPTTQPQKATHAEAVAA